MQGKRWDLLLVRQSPPAWHSPVGVPRQLAEPDFQALTGQKGGNRSHPGGQDVPKGKSHNRKGSSPGPHQLKFLD